MVFFFGRAWPKSDKRRDTTQSEMQTEPKELGEEQANPQNMNVNA